MFGGNNPPTGTTGFASTGFSFGNTGTTSSGGGLSFGGTAQPASTGTTGFSFGGTSAPGSTASTSGSSGFLFGTSTQSGLSQGSTNQAPAASGFSLAGSAQPTGTSGLSLAGSTQPTGTSGFSLSGTTQPAGTTGFSLSGSTQPAGTTGFSSSGSMQPTGAAAFPLGGSTQPTGTTLATSGGLGFGLSAQPGLTKPPNVQPATQTATSGFSLTKPAGQTTTAATGGFSLSNQPTVTLGGLPRPTQPAGVQPTATTTAPVIFGGAVKTGATTATSSQPSSNLGVASGFSLGGSTSAAPSLGGLEKTKTATVGFSVPTTATAGTGATAPPTQMNYQQLEENINKWMQELEKQEKEFLEQATHVNAWDRLLVENGEKITSLNSDMERVKVEQQKLDHELDFIKSQQRELEELLVPLEKSVEEQPNISFQQHADLERENTYQLSENIDAQLKRMLQDLKEIIDHLNTSNANQDNTDPIFQITQILNSHMDSLQWIDQNSALLKRHAEDISKQMETQRKEQERNFRLVYN